MVKEQNRNLTRIFFLLKYHKKSFDLFQNKVNDIIKIIEKGNINKQNLRELIYEIFSKNYNKNRFLNDVFKSVNPCQMK